MKIGMREIVELDLTILEVDEGIQLLEGDVDRRECSECEERMGLPDGVEEWDICRACPVMRKMKPEIEELLRRAGV